MTHTIKPDADDLHDEFEPATPDRLQAHYRRQLSAMLDGELSTDEGKFMQRRLEHDAGLAACRERWQVCGDVLRGQPVSLLPADFADRVVAGLRAQAPLATVPAPRARARGWGGRLALAASVAVVGLFVGRQLPVGGDGSAATPRASVAMEGSSGGAGSGQPAVNPVPVAPVEVTLGDAVGSDGGIASAVAVATLPMAVARSRGQGQRAARRVRAAAADRASVVAGAAPTLMAVGGDGAFARVDPFLASSIAPARPWPRAVLAGADAGSRFATAYPEPTLEWTVPALEAMPMPESDGASSVPPTNDVVPVAGVD